MTRKIWIEGQSMDMSETLKQMQEQHELCIAKITELELKVSKLEANQPTELQKMRMKRNAK